MSRRGRRRGPGERAPLLAGALGLAAAVALAVPAAVAMAVAVGGCATAGGVAATRPAGAFDLPALDGSRVSLEALRGRVVVLDFWASWCAPCRDELPQLEQLRKVYEPRGAAFVTVNVDNDRDAAERAARSLGVTMPVGLDPEKVVAAAYQLPTMPTSFVIDRRGVVRHVHEGFTGSADVERLRAELEALLRAAE